MVQVRHRWSWKGVRHHFTISTERWLPNTAAHDRRSGRAGSTVRAVSEFGPAEIGFCLLFSLDIHAGTSMLALTGLRSVVHDSTGRPGLRLSRGTWEGGFRYCRRRAVRGRASGSDNCEALSTDAGSAGGPARSSGDPAVMAGERRGRTVQSVHVVNREDREELGESDEVVG
jgi:hypothetical protein